MTAPAPAPAPDGRPLAAVSRRPYSVLKASSEVPHTPSAGGAALLHRVGGFLFFIIFINLGIRVAPPAPGVRTGHLSSRAQSDMGDDDDDDL